MLFSSNDELHPQSDAADEMDSEKPEGNTTPHTEEERLEILEHIHDQKRRYVVGKDGKVKIIPGK